jgi:hypothetical protein
VIFEKVQGSSQDVLIVRQSSSSNEISMGQNALSKNIMSAMLQIQKNLKDNFQIDLKEALVLAPDRLDVITVEGWQIYFNLQSDIGLEIVKLNLLLGSQISSDERKKLQYIDLRFKDRAYYK